MRYVKGDTRYIHFHHPKSLYGWSTPLLQIETISRIPSFQRKSNHSQSDHKRKQRAK